MATSALLRNFSRGSQIILRTKYGNGQLSCLLKPNINSQPFSVAPVTKVWVPEYFRARRGPFTPAEKQGTPMMFTSTAWKIERFVAVSMIGIMPAALLVQGPIMNFVLTTTVFLHGFWGFDHVLSDYLQKFIPFIHYIWYILSILAFAGLLHFNYNDVGVCKAVEMLWKV